jgi:hypothetical protein
MALQRSVSSNFVIPLKYQKEGSTLQILAFWLWVMLGSNQ